MNFNKLFMKKVNEEDTLYYLLGHRIYKSKKNGEKAVFNRLKRVETILKSTVTIEGMKPAQGLLRDIQLVNFKILKEVKRVCDTHKLPYFINYGTLLGTARHKGYIPWDDDIDISMMRDDYEKFIEIFNNNKKDNNLIAEYFTTQKGGLTMIKVRHKDIPILFIDVFVFDYCYKEMNFAEKLEFDNKIKTLTKKHSKLKKKMSADEFVKSFKKLKEDNIENLNDNGLKNPTVFSGLEYLTYFSVFDYDTIFPLSTIEFEGETFSTVNNPDEYLTYLYKDYMSMPNNIDMHFNPKNVSVEEILSIKKYKDSK